MKHQGLQSASACCDLLKGLKAISKVRGEVFAATASTRAKRSGTAGQTATYHTVSLMTSTRTTLFGIAAIAGLPTCTRYGSKRVDGLDDGYVFAFTALTTASDERVF